MPKSSYISLKNPKTPAMVLEYDVQWSILLFLTFQCWQVWLLYHSALETKVNWTCCVSYIRDKHVTLLVDNNNPGNLGISSQHGAVQAVRPNQAALHGKKLTSPVLSALNSHTSGEIHKRCILLKTIQQRILCDQWDLV